MKKIFYSWQSDVPADKTYLAKRLENAVANVTDFEVETATRNTTGSADISSTILAKIADSDLFIADVSIVDTGSNGRHFPNPNVIYELGYALGILGEERVILIANSQRTSTSNLPFDIRNRRMILTGFDDSSKSSIERTLTRVMSDYTTPRNDDVPAITLASGSDGWANWGGAQQGSGFRFYLDIDNFGGTREFIDDIKVIAIDAEGNPWSTSHFKFDDLEPNRKLKVEANDIMTSGVFMTDRLGETYALLPDLDIDTVEIIAKLRSNGREIHIPVPVTHLGNRPARVELGPTSDTAPSS